MLNAVQREICATDSATALTYTGTLEGYIGPYSYGGLKFGFLLITVFA